MSEKDRITYRSAQVPAAAAGLRTQMGWEVELAARSCLGVLACAQASQAALVVLAEVVQVLDRPVQSRQP